VAEGVRKDEEFSGTKPVEERHRIDELRLDGWMREHVEGYQGPLTVLQFKGGQSNPTYRLDTPGRSYVMRRKPFGKLLPSAHAVDREFKVIAALSKQGFPVAKAYALCTDDAVIGAAFYIMSMEEGRVFWDPTLPRQTPQARHAIFTSKIETLARLHQYDPQAIGLGDFGKPGNYFARQVDRWTKQYRASETEHIPEVEKLIEWLTGSAVPDLNWYFSYNLFRLAGITQGIAGRIRDGTAANAKAIESAKRTVPLAKASWEYAQKAGAK